MSHRTRAALAACWTVAAFVLLRMAYGGGPGGIIYVVRFNHPAVLITGAIVIAGALTTIGLLVRGPSTRAAALSVGLALIALPLSVVLATQDHGSAPILGLAALAALLIAIPVTRRPLAVVPPDG